MNRRFGPSQVPSRSIWMGANRGTPTSLPRLPMWAVISRISRLRRMRSSSASMKSLRSKLWRVRRLSQAPTGHSTGNQHQHMHSVSLKKPRTASISEFGIGGTIADCCRRNWIWKAMMWGRPTRRIESSVPPLTCAATYRMSRDRTYQDQRQSIPDPSRSPHDRG